MGARHSKLPKLTPEEHQKELMIYEHECSRGMKVEKDQEAPEVDDRIGAGVKASKNKGKKKHHNEKALEKEKKDKGEVLKWRQKMEQEDRVSERRKVAEMRNLPKSKDAAGYGSMAAIEAAMRKQLVRKEAIRAATASFILACSWGDLEEARQIVRRTPLYLADWNRDESTLLLAMQGACQGGHLATAQWLARKEFKIVSDTRERISLTNKHISDNEKGVLNDAATYSEPIIDFLDETYGVTSTIFAGAIGGTTRTSTARMEFVVDTATNVPSKAVDLSASQQAVTLLREWLLGVYGHAVSPGNTKAEWRELASRTQPPPASGALAKIITRQRGGSESSSYATEFIKHIITATNSDSDSDGSSSGGANSYSSDSTDDLPPPYDDCRSGVVH